MISRLFALVAGIWLMFAPAVLDYDNPAAANDRIFGPIGAAFAFVALWEVLRPLRWATLPVGTWLIVAPLVMDYGGAAIGSSLIAGLVMAATAPLGGETKQTYGGGWSSLLPGREVPAGSQR